MLSIEHKDFWVVNFSVGEEESFLTESRAATTCSNVDVELSLRNLFKLKVDLFKAL